MKLYPLNSEIVLRATPQEVWKTIALGFGGIAKYASDVKTSTYLNDQRTGVNTTRLCTLKPFGKMEETVTEWENQKLLEVTITTSTAPIKPGTAMRFMLIGTGETTVLKVVGQYRIKGPGFMSRLMKGMMQKSIDGYLKDLKSEVEKEA